MIEILLKSWKNKFRFTKINIVKNENAFLERGEFRLYSIIIKKQYLKNKNIKNINLIANFK